jgi:MFS family permease
MADQRPEDPAELPPADGPPPLRRRLLVDITPLKRYRQFRILWLGYLVSTLGTQLTVVAVPFQIYKLTHSSLDVGLLGIAQLGPLLVGSLVGGSIADAVDRRHLLMVTSTVMGACSIGLAVNSLGGSPMLWPLYVLTAISTAFAAVDSSARSATMAAIVEPESFSSAVALWQLLFQVATVAGPAIAGLILAQFGIVPIYVVDAASSVIAFLAVLSLHNLHAGGEKTTFGIQSIKEGFAYLKGRQAIQGTFVVDLNAMIFGMPRAVFPALGLGYFHGGPQTVGLLYSAPGAGALVGALLTGWVHRIRRQGIAVIIAVAIWGAAIALFGVTKLLGVALLLLAIAGAADVISAVFRGTILQTGVPDALRGRLSSIHIAVVTGGPRIGDAETGAVAEVTSPQFAVVSGGLACLAGLALIAWRMPRFTHYDAHKALENAERLDKEVDAANAPPGQRSAAEAG